MQETQDLNSSEQFNHFYSQNPEAFYERSLLDFYQSVVSKKITIPSRVLDLGPGTKSLFEDVVTPGLKVVAMDYSQTALELVRKNSPIDYRWGDITKDSLVDKECYDLVFDSHCLHCVVDPEDRRVSFKNILELMKPGALFASEMMVQPVGIKTAMSFKYIPEAFDLERELQNAGFKIEYFMIGRGLVFKNAHGECDVLRVMARK